MAILFAQSLVKLASVETGLNVESVAGFSISPERSGYTPERSAELFERIERELALLPGVDSATGSMVSLLTGAAWGRTVAVEGFASDRESDHTSVNSVGPDFHETLGIPLLAGRSFEAADSAGRPKVAIVNRRFAEHYGLLPDPVGKRMTVGDPGTLDIEIVGVVEDSAYDGIRGEKPIQFYLPWRQEPRLSAMTFYVRTSLEPEAMLPQLAAIVARIDPDIPVESLRTLPAQARIGLSNERTLSFAAAGFAALATGLAALGVYGALNLNLSRRRREVALRLALGASPAQVKTLLLGQLFRLGVFGVGVGLLCALALGRFAEALLFGVSGHEPMALLLAVLVVIVVALLSAWSPLRRSSRIDPMQSLRQD
jgi:predicted permease